MKKIPVVICEFAQGCKHYGCLHKKKHYRLFVACDNCFCTVYGECTNRVKKARCLRVKKTVEKP